MKRLVVILLLAMVPAALGADWEVIEEHWYTVEIGGARTGWMVERVRSDGQRYESGTQLHMSIRRGPAEVTVEISASIVETHDGEPLVMRSRQHTGLQAVDTEWRFEDDRVVQTTRQGDRETVRDRPLPEGEWLTPMEVQRYWDERREAGAEQITYRTIDPQAGLKPVSFTLTLRGEDEHELGDRTIPVTVWEVTTSLMPLLTFEEHISADGYLVYQEVAAGFAKMVMRIATRAEAQGGAGDEPPELLVKTFIEPDRAILRPQAATTARLRLEVGAGTMPPLPEAGAQRVVIAGEGRLAVLTIDINDNLPARPGEADAGEFLESSAMVDAGDPLIESLADKALRGAGKDQKDRMERAETLRAFVHRYVNEKDLDTAFATASETAARRSGDCSEHAVLLCAMMRADGIPARLAVGLIYTDRFLGRDGIFGWHMWTQALIDGHWVDFDATLPRRYHAAHVLTGTSSLAEGALAGELASAIVLMGNLDIKVLDVGYE